MLRFLFLPFFLLCNYRPAGVERLWPALMHWDYAFWGATALFGLTGGYVSSLAMMYCPRYTRSFATITFGNLATSLSSFAELLNLNMPLRPECLVRHQLSPEYLPE